MSKITHFLHHVDFIGFRGGRMKEEKWNNKISLFIPEQLLEDNNFSNYALATYCVLQAMSVPAQQDRLCITYQQIVFYLIGDIPDRRNRIFDYIKCGVNELIDNKMIRLIKEINKHLVLDCYDLYLDTNKHKFTIITFQEVQKIFQIKNVNNFLLLKYFVILIGTISSQITVYLPNGEYKNRVVGNFTIDYLSEISGISTKSIIDYNKLLEEANLVYIFRHSDFVLDKNKSIKRLANIYGRPENKKYVDTFAEDQQEYTSSYKYSEKTIHETNNKRSLAQKYQQLLKNKTVNYSKDEIMEIYQYVVSENNKYNKLYEKEKYTSYLDKIRDISVFDKFDFIKTKDTKRE